MIDTTDALLIVIFIVSNLYLSYYKNDDINDAITVVTQRADRHLRTVNPRYSIHFPIWLNHGKFITTFTN